MNTPDELFEQYTSLRLQGQTEGEAQRNLIYGIQGLTISSQISLKQRFQAWEAERTHADFDIQERMKLSNSTTEIILCPICESPNHITLKHCQVCGTVLIIDTRNEPETKAAKAFDESFLLILSSPSQQRQLRLQPQRAVTGLRLGRYDPDSSVDVDLTELDAVDLGVSRLHALLEYDHDNQEIYLTDLNSRNGTFVNGFKLPAHKRSRLRDGDELCLGCLNFILSFQSIQN